MARHIGWVVLFACASACQVAPATSPPEARIQVSFKLDPRLFGGTYGGERWVSAPTYSSAAQPGHQATVEAKVEIANAAWVPSDPDMIRVSPVPGARPNRVRITVKRAGQCTLAVRAPGASTELLVKGKPVGANAIQVEIIQPGEKP